MPKISPFGISDKNNYESKFMCKIWHTVLIFQNWSFANLITQKFLTCISPIQYAQYWQVSFIFISCSSLELYLPLFDNNAKIIYIYTEISKWEINSECTLRIRANVLSQFSCKSLLVESAIWTSAESSIMWSATENLLLWINVLD